MSATGNGRQGFHAAMVLILVASAAGAAEAATCKDELDRFESRLHGSTMAATDPDTFQALVRQAEEAAELRDEEQCLRTVAALNAALPEDSGAQPVTRGTSTTRSRPAAPVLMMAGGDEADTARAEEKTESAAAGNDEGEDKRDEKRED